MQSVLDVQAEELSLGTLVHQFQQVALLVHGKGVDGQGSRNPGILRVDALHILAIQHQVGTLALPALDLAGHLDFLGYGVQITQLGHVALQQVVLGAEDVPE